MSTLPHRQIIRNFSKPTAPKTTFQTPLQRLTTQHQQDLQNHSKQTAKQLNYLTEKKHQLDRAIPGTKQPVQTHLKRASQFYGQQAASLRAKINGDSKK